VGGVTGVPYRYLAHRDYSGEPPHARLGVVTRRLAWRRWWAMAGRYLVCGMCGREFTGERARGRYTMHRCRRAGKECRG
jgi:hypothetical protein